MSEITTEELEGWVEETCEHCRLLFTRQDCASADCSAKKAAILHRLRDYDALKAKTTVEGIGYSEWKQAIAERDALKGEVERLRVQLAGCSVAALGGTKDPAKQGDYGWSASYQDTLDLRLKYEKAEASLAAARPLIEAAMSESDDEYGTALIEAAKSYRAQAGK